MKKIIASAVGLMLAGGLSVTTAQAVENQFGGYWRTRMFVQDSFSGTESLTRIDNRTRLYYTAKFSDDFKFVNKFEFDTIWGDSVGGDIGADGTIFEVKNSYADFNLANWNFKMGIQPAVVARGFLFDDDFSGVVATGNFGNVSVTPVWIRVDAEDFTPKTNNRDMFGVIGGIKVSDALMVNPYFIADMTSGSESWDNYYVGADVDMKMDAASVWGTFIYNTYEIDRIGDAPADVDGDAFLVAGGVKAGMVRGQAFYASGDDAFINPPGASYYWAEIMGYGVFDNAVPDGTPANQISNVAAFGAGVTVKPADKVSLDFDVWYAFLDEEDANGEAELGLEFDGKLSYALMDSLKLEAILAYLVAGDAANGGEDAFEGGVRVSLSF
ncbi:MAG: hypothetical protein V2I32_04870 [Desulforhopalus sp.]|jgi:hypothetical protein|nr:hypothetical protein [Desulforhopalus sp.]